MHYVNGIGTSGDETHTLYQTVSSFDTEDLHAGFGDGVAISVSQGVVCLVLSMLP